MFKSKRNLSGFTLIELLVVLAIIGILIALAVVGLQAAQATQRDTARKDIANQMNAALQSWISNNNGSLPTAAQFYGAANTDFIDSATTCNGGEAVNNTCVGLDGLTWAAPKTGANKCTAANYVAPSNTYVLCYDPTQGSAGYTMGVMLEGSTTPYAVAQ